MEGLILGFLDKIGSIDFGFVWELFFYSLGIFWLVVIYWVWLDSGERTSNRAVRYLYILLVTLFNIVGWIIYLIIRPSQTIEEIYWSDLERRYLKYETAELGDCPKCGTQLLPGYTFCPNCRYMLKKKCPSCKVYVDRKSKYCPHCGEETGKRIAPEELSPSVEVMEQQIQATKEEAVEAVESNMTRYSTRKSITVKVGASIISIVSQIKNSLKGISSKIVEPMKKSKSRSQEKYPAMVGKSKKSQKSKSKKKRKSK